MGTYAMLKPRDASARYQEIELASRLNSVDAHGLVTILYEELVQSLDVLAARMRLGTKSSQEPSAIRARSILAALLTSLDPERGGNTAALFAQVYRGMLSGLNQAISTFDGERVQEVRSAALEMQHTWLRIKSARD